MSRRPCKPLPTTLIVQLSGDDSGEKARLIERYATEDPIVRKAYNADRRWFRAHPGRRRHVRRRIPGEFPAEERLPRFLMVEVTLLPDGRICAHPLAIDSPKQNKERS
jgi:hypothetical protein